MASGESKDSGVETENESSDSSVIQTQNCIDHTKNNISTALMQFESWNIRGVQCRSKVGEIQELPLTNIQKPVQLYNVRNIMDSKIERCFEGIPIDNMKTNYKFMNTNYYDNSLRQVETSLVHRTTKYFRNNLKPHRRNLYDRLEYRMRLAASTNNVAMMKQLLAEDMVSPNNSDELGRSPLHLASSRGYTEIVQLLLQYGANPNKRDSIGNTPLHLAAVARKISIVTLLLKAGTNVQVSDQHGHNPLQLAMTRLKLLHPCKGLEMNKIKEEVRDIVEMLAVYLRKQNDTRDRVESLSDLCSQLSISSTTNQVEDGVRQLLANVEALSIAK